MSRKQKVLVALSLLLMFGNAVMLGFSRDFTALLWLLFGAGTYLEIIHLNIRMLRLFKVIEDQADYIKEADEHIHYLTQLDIFSQYRECSRQERIASANSFRYLQGLVRLKKENDQLKILNKNLLHNQGKGVKNYAKSTKPRNSKD